MVDLTEICGDTPLRASLVKKRAKEQEKLDKITVKAAPIQAEIAMYDEMIAAIDRRAKAAGQIAAAESGAQEDESTENPTGTAADVTQQIRPSSNIAEGAAVNSDENPTAAGAGHAETGSPAPATESAGHDAAAADFARHEELRKTAPQMTEPAKKTPSWAETSTHAAEEAALSADLQANTEKAEAAQALSGGIEEMPVPAFLRKSAV